MTTFAILVLCFSGFGGQATPPLATPHWPMVPASLFAVNGIEAGGSSPVQHVMVAIKPDSQARPKMEVDSVFFGLPAASPAWKTLQIAFISTTDGTLARFGGLSLVVKGGHLWFSKEGNQFDISPIRDGNLNDVQIVKHYDSLFAYVNGEKCSQTIRPTAPLLPVTVGLDTWKGNIVGVVGYARELTFDEVVANQHAGQAISKSLFGDTKTITVDAVLGAFTEVPSLDRIAPYRTALVADEYTISNITAGRMSALKPGMKIRIMRWGLISGDKTDVAKAKTGDHATMTIQPLSADPKYEKEFQVDTLDGDITALYFVDVTPQKS